MKIFTSARSIVAAALLASAATCAYAGDGTKDNPYTVAELNAQKDALAASGSTVWVKADLKGLGTEGSQAENGTTDDTRNECAALFADETGTFVAYSYHILANLAVSDLTNTKGLLISLTYQKGGHDYGNTANPQYASNYEPADELHFSLDEVHGALSLHINGYRGYHIASSYVVPEFVTAVKVSAGYSMNNGAYVNCNNIFNGNAETTYVTPKNAAMVLMAAEGTYDFTLKAALYEQTISNGNALQGGTQAGLNTITTNNRYLLRFIATDDRIGFERNSENQKEVTLASKDEVYLMVSSLATNFWGNFDFPTAEKDWINWNGKSWQDFPSAGISTPTLSPGQDAIYDLSGRRLPAIPHRGIYIQNGKKKNIVTLRSSR